MAATASSPAIERQLSNQGHLIPSEIDRDGPKGVDIVRQKGHSLRSTGKARVLNSTHGGRKQQADPSRPKDADAPANG